MTTRDEILEMARPWVKMLFWIVLAAVLVFSLRQLFPLVLWIFNVLQPFLIALIVAYVLFPIVLFVQKKLRLGRIGGIAVLGVTIVVIMTGMLVWLIPVLWDQVLQTVNELKNLPNTIKGLMSRYRYSEASIAQVTGWLTWAGAQIKEMFSEGSGGMGSIKPVAEGGLTAVRSVAGGVVSGVSATIIFIGTTAFVILIAFYYLLDMGCIPPIIRKMLPAQHRERIWDILVQADRSVGGFLRGQLIACIIVAVLTSILLFSVGMKQYAILISIFAGVMHLIPYLGPIAGGTPAVLWVLMSQSERFTSWGQRGVYVLVLLAGFAVIETIDGLVTQPLIVGRSASLHPLLVMLALAVGAQFGIGGMIIAVPMACFARVLWMELYWKKRTE